MTEDRGHMDPSTLEMMWLILKNIWDLWIQRLLLTTLLSTTKRRIPLRLSLAISVSMMMMRTMMIVTSTIDYDVSNVMKLTKALVYSYSPMIFYYVVVISKVIFLEQSIRE